MKVTEQQLRDRVIPRLTVRSVTLSVCTVEVDLDDGCHVLCDRAGKVMRFNGVEDARNALAHLKVREAILHHDSPFHEMVGLEGGAEPIRVPLAWAEA